MNRESDKLEHLFSRALDGECTPDERRLLKSILRDDPQARAFFRDYQNLDREVGDALRMAVGRSSPQVIQFPTFWRKAGQGLVVAAAACLATLAWLRSAPPAPQRTSPAPVEAAMTSWFAPRQPQGDVVEPLPTAYERPELRLRGIQRQWIVVPGDQPGTYFVVEVDHVRTHVITVHKDF